MQQLFRIERQRIGFHRGGGRDRCRDDLALRLQALHTCLDQAGTELVEIEKADKQRDQTANVENKDASRQ